MSELVTDVDANPAEPVNLPNTLAIISAPVTDVDANPAEPVNLPNILAISEALTDAVPTFLETSDSSTTMIDENGILESNVADIDCFEFEEVCSIKNDSGLCGDLGVSVIDTDEEYNVSDGSRIVLSFSESSCSDDCDETYKPESFSESSSEFSASDDESLQGNCDSKEEKKALLPQESITQKNAAAGHKSMKRLEKDISSAVMVARTNNTNNKRKWDKAQFCLYCLEKKSKIARHLEDTHAKEMEVAQVMSIDVKEGDADGVKSKKRRERARLFNLIRKRGNFNHNMEVLKTNEGVFIVEKRPTDIQPHTNYLPCEYCLGFYHKLELRKHMKRCSEKLTGAIVGKRVQISASMLLCTDDLNASPDLQHVFSKMNYDDVSLCLRNDELIVQFGNRLCLKLRKEGDQQHYISNKVRELARLVIETRKCCSDVSSLRDCLAPKNFAFVVEAATDLSGWNEEEGTLSSPSIGIKLGHSLKKCAKILKGEAIRNGIKTLKTQADDFSTLMELSWNDEISRAARTELEQRKWNRPLLLPLTADLQTVRKHLKTVISSATIALAKKNNNTENYRNLLTAILASIILFNRRRAGEPALLKIEDYQKRLSGISTVNDEVKDSLSLFELQLCQNFKRIELRGKRGRKVPLLLTKEAEAGMNLLIHLRNDVGTNPKNPFVFPVIGNGSVKNVRGPDAIRKHVRLCTLKCPGAIYSTNLRKHVATLSQLLNLEKNELEMLAKFLGHDVSIHREYYRLPEDTLQLAKCSKLLLLMEQGGVGRQSGKTLAEIEVNLEDVVEDAEEDARVEDSAEIEENAAKDATEDHVLKETDSDDETGRSSDEEPCRNVKQTRKKRKAITWSEEEIAAVRKYLEKFFRTGKVPKKGDIDPALNDIALKHRTWRDVKNYVHNYHQSQRKKIRNMKK